MFRLLRKLALAAALTAWAAAGTATPVVSLVPSAQRVLPPDFFTIDVVLSGLQSGGRDTLLGAFDLTVQYNARLVELLDLATLMGTGLGDPTDSAQAIAGQMAPTFDSTTGTGSFRFFEVSLLEASAASCVFCLGPYLEDLQSDTFTLATLQFYAPLIPGHTVDLAHFRVERGSVEFGDANGNAINNVAIRDTTVTIPEPGSAWLVVSPLVAIGWAVRRRKPQPVRAAAGLAPMGVRTSAVTRRLLAVASAAAVLAVTAAVPAFAGPLVAKDANHLVMQEIVVSDLAQLGILVGEDAQNQIPWSGYITDSGFSLSINTPYRDGLLAVTYTGTFDPVADQVSWTGVTQFTNAVGSLSWDSSGSYADATKDGFWKWARRVVKRIAQAAATIDIVTDGLQIVASVATAGAGAAPASMISSVVHTVTSAATTINTAVEVVKVIQDAAGSTSGSTTRQGVLPPDGFAAPGLVQAQPSYIEVLSKSLMTGNYQQAVVYVNGTTSVNGTLCLTAAFPGTMDTYVSGVPAARDNNYGMQEFIATGGGFDLYSGTQGKYAYIKFDIPVGFKDHLPKNASAALTVHGFDGGTNGTVHALDMWLVTSDWSEGNGFEGSVAQRPPGAADPAVALGVDWTTRPGIEAESAAHATLTQGVAKKGSTVNFNMDQLMRTWLRTEPNRGVVLLGGVADAYVRFGSREGKLYNMPGAVAGPKLTLSWYDKGDFNRDGLIDVQDVNAVLGRMGPVTALNQFYDLDGDGRVTVLDSRKLARCCSRPNCASL